MDSFPYALLTHWSAYGGWLSLLMHEIVDYPQVLRGVFFSTDDI